MMEESALATHAVERMMKAKDVLYRLSVGQIRVREAAEILGVTDRTIRRYRARMKEGGDAVLVDCRCIRPSPKRIPEEVRVEVKRLFREEYFDFNVRHFHEQLVGHHNISVSYTWVKKLLMDAGLVKRGRKRGTYRRRRERRPMEGMLLHLDGSTHRWLGPKQPMFDLLVVMDDATSEVHAATFVNEESTLTCLRILHRVVHRRGAFRALYTDRASHFVMADTRNKTRTPRHRTQVERALNQLDIQLICAHSPQARGRSERLFGTWQSRLVPEMRRAGVTTMEEANTFLERVFVPWHNRTLRTDSLQPGTAFTPVTRRDLDRVFSAQHSRVVQRDLTVRDEGRFLQRPNSPETKSLAKKRVTVYVHTDGLLTIGYGEHTPGCYRASDGCWLNEQRPAKEAA